MYYSDTEDNYYGETRKNQCETKKKSFEPRRNIYEIRKRPNEIKKKPCNEESTSQRWIKMYKKNKFTVKAIYCVACFGFAIILFQRVIPNLITK